MRRLGTTLKVPIEMGIAKHLLTLINTEEQQKIKNLLINDIVPSCFLKSLRAGR